MIFDTHAHYDDEAFDEDRDELLSSLNKEGISRVVNIASSMPSCETTLELTRKYDFIYGAVGVHPCETEGLTDKDLELVEKYCDDPKAVAVGEIGLDYYWDEPGRERQRDFFIRQLHIAKKKGLPVVVHSRDAAADTLDILKAEHAEDIGGVIHCYAYSAEMAKEYAKMGFYIGVGGVITFKNGRKLKECVEQLPLSSIVIETDCPYLAPVPYRGKRNSSLNLTFVVKEIADIKGISTREVEEITFNNARELYGL